jgi:hypothetical protein
LEKLEIGGRDRLTRRSAANRQLHVKRIGGSPEGTMTVRFERQGLNLHIEWLRPVAGRVASLLFFAPALWIGHYLAIGLWQNFSSEGSLGDDLAGVAIFLLLTLVLAATGYVMATFRYLIDIDPASGEVVATRRFGPLVSLQGRRKLSEFTGVSIVRDLDAGDPERRSWFPVNLYGREGTKPLEIASFPKREDADDFAAQLGAALDLKPADFADTPADDPDLPSQRARSASSGGAPRRTA